jgi:hypothetical protein
MSRSRATPLIVTCLLACARWWSDDECPPAFEPGDRLRLTGPTAAEILGRGPRAFPKSEAGTQAAKEPADTWHAP